LPQYIPAKIIEKSFPQVAESLIIHVGDSVKFRGESRTIELSA